MAPIRRSCSASEPSTQCTFDGEVWAATSSTQRSSAVFTSAIPRDESAPMGHIRQKGGTLPTAEPDGQAAPPASPRAGSLDDGEQLVRFDGLPELRRDLRDG